MPCSCVFMRVCVKDSETVIDGERLFVCSKLALGLQGQMHVLTTNTWLFVISFSHWDWLRSTAGWMNRRQVRSLISFHFVFFVFMIEKGRVRTRCYTWLVRDILTGSTMPKYTLLNQRIDAITRKVQGVAWKARGRILSVETSYTARLVKRCSMRYSTVQTSWASRYLFVFFFQADFLVIF